VTDVPFTTVSVLGLNAKFCIETAFFPVPVGCCVHPEKNRIDGTMLTRIRKLIFDESSFFLIGLFSNMKK